MRTRRVFLKSLGGLHATFQQTRFCIKMDPECALVSISLIQWKTKSDGFLKEYKMSLK